MRTDPRIASLVADLARFRDELARAVDAVPASRREVIPGDGSWSVANVLDHLAATEQLIARVVRGFVSAASERAADEVFDRGAFDQSVDLSFFLDRSRKIRGAQPKGELDAVSAWASLGESRRVLLAELEHAHGRKLEDQTRPHPATGAPMNGYQWIAFVGVHEGRHALQVGEIGVLVADGSE